MPTVTASSNAQRLYRDECGPLNPLDDELCDPVSLLDLDWEDASVVKVHLDLASVVRIDHSGSVQHAHAMQRSHTRPGMNESGEPHRNSNRHSRSHQPPLAGQDRHVLRCDQVRASVRRVLPLRNLRRLRNDLDVQCVLLCHLGEARVVQLLRHRYCPCSAATVFRHDDVRLPSPFVVLVLRVRSVDEHHEISVLL